MLEMCWYIYGKIRIEKKQTLILNVIKLFALSNHTLNYPIKVYTF